MKYKIKAFLEKQSKVGGGLLASGLLGYTLGQSIPSYILNKKTEKLLRETAESDTKAVKEVLKGILGGTLGVTGGLLAYKKGKSLDKKGSVPEAYLGALGVGGALGLADGAFDGYHFSKLKKQILKENKTITEGAKKIKNLGYLAGLGSLATGLAYYKGKADSKKGKADSKKGKADSKKGKND